ncbi:MAG: phenylalanine--tRNA ligase subunit alpha [Patescibacteria group bacterium]|nr:phenylalanine--tRNA ligase subunit alpha [Patescibacteria group bacterium]
MKSALNEGQSAPAGHLHPVSQLIAQANAIFYDLGFEFGEGPLLETEWYNFDALNVPAEHPARDMQDTFYLKGTQGVLRTHTSNAQIRYMEGKIKEGVPPPYRMICAGKVFRNEATDMTHEAEFYQLEGLAVGEDITLAHLKWTLTQFFERLFKGSVEIEFRPSYFPFVEPGLEVSMRLTGDNTPEKLRNKWIEIMGAGMVHPNVLNNSGVDPQRFRGWAFGMGLDRLAMLKWGIDDVRLMHSGDLRFIHQF